MASARSTVNDGAARVGRTAVFGTSAEVIIQFIEAFIKDFNEAQHVAALGMLTLVINTAVVGYEHVRDKGLFLRSVPPRNAAVTGE